VNEELIAIGILLIFAVPACIAIYICNKTDKAIKEEDIRKINAEMKSSYPYSSTRRNRNVNQSSSRYDNNNDVSNLMLYSAIINSDDDTKHHKNQMPDGWFESVTSHSSPKSYSSSSYDSDSSSSSDSDSSPSSDSGSSGGSD
jgi:hypothetical protein